MKDQIEYQHELFIGVAEVDRSYYINEIEWYELDNDGDERRVKIWDVPVDIRKTIESKLISMAQEMEENDKKPDPMSLSHEHKENC
jgi:hypothetical protein